MKEGIELPKQTIDALLNRASMFIVPISEGTNEHVEDFKLYGDDSKIIECHSKLQRGDNFFVQEEFAMDIVNYIHYLADYDNEYDRNQMDYHYGIIEASKMTEKQSRYKGIIVDVDVKRVQEIYGNYKAILMNTSDELGYIESQFKKWFNTQFKVKYEDNPCVFLYIVKEEKMKEGTNE